MTQPSALDPSWKEVYGSKKSHVFDGLYRPLIVLSFLLTFTLFSIAFSDQMLKKNAIITGFALLNIAVLLITLYQLRKSLKDRSVGPGVLQGKIQDLTTTYGKYPTTYLKLQERMLHFPAGVRPPAVIEQIAQEEREVSVSYLPNQKIILSVHVRDVRNG